MQFNRIDRRVSMMPVRVVFPHLDKPDAVPGSTDTRYSLTLLIPKGDTKLLEELKQAAALAVSDKWGKQPGNLRLPFKDGDAKEQEYLHGHFYLDAKTKNAIPVFDPLKKRIEASEVYGGCYCAVVVSFFGYEMTGNKGVGCGLEYVMKVQEGEKIGGGGDAAKMVEGFDFSGFSPLGGGTEATPDANPLGGMTDTSSDPFSLF